MPEPPTAWPAKGGSEPSLRRQAVQCFIASAIVLAGLFALIWIMGPDEATQVTLFGP